MGSYFCAAVKVVVQEVAARLVVLVQGIGYIVVGPRVDDLLAVAGLVVVEGG